MHHSETTWSLVPVHRMQPHGQQGRCLVTLAAPAALAADPWLGLLLPTRNYNRELIAALERARLPEQAIVGAFLAHPFLDLDRLLSAIEGAGARGIAAFPGISRLATGFADTAIQGGLALATEARALIEAGERGFATMATVGAPGMGPPPGELVPDWVLTVPRVSAAELPNEIREGILDYRAGAGRGEILSLTRRRTLQAP